MVKDFYYLLIFIILGLSTKVEAQYTPHFKNYLLSPYNAGNQNWGISAANEGKIYVANNEGLLSFDGYRWDLYNLPNKTPMRSVLAYKDEIYTGSYEEFGFWKEDDFGNFNYTSLTDSLQIKTFHDEEFWQIIPFKNTILFRSFRGIYQLKDNKVTSITAPSTIMSLSIIEDKLYVATLNDGIFTLDNNKLVSFLQHEKLKNTKIVKIIPYQNQLLIATSLHGIFLYDGNTLSVFDKEINETVKEHQLNIVNRLDNGNLIFGTIKNGIYLVDKTGKIIFNLNKKKGLKNNTILSQSIYNKQFLWLGLDNGIAKVTLDDNALFYSDFTGELGAVYDVIKYKETTYIASNTGVYYFDNNGELQFISGSQGQAWDLDIIDGDLVCGHNDGTYLINDKNIQLISPYTGGWVIKKLPGYENIYIQGTYTGLVRFKKINGKWDAKHLKTPSMPIRYLAIENANTIWTAHTYKGLYKVQLDSEAESVTSVKNYKNKGLFNNYNVRVYNIKNDICFFTNEGWQKYEPLQDSIVLYPELNQQLGKDAYIISEFNEDNIVIKNSGNVIAFKTIGANPKTIPVNNNLYQSKLIVGNERVTQFSDSLYALTYNNGFVLFKNHENKSNLVFPPKIERIFIDDKPINKNEKLINIPFKKKIDIDISSPQSINYYFEYAIVADNEKPNWQKMKSERLELTQLINDSYTLYFRTKNQHGTTSDPSKINITVMPPWYKGNVGYVLYSLIVICTLVLFYILHKRNLKRKQTQLKKELERKQAEKLKEQTLENERKLALIKAKSLENELKLKSKQLANTAVALVKKNESMLDLKSELAKNKNSFNNSIVYKKLLKSIDSAIGNDDQWKLFEHNFNQVHEEFFTILKQKHPKLTRKDLKMSAYIKMNLNTKKIATLMNITTRGAETHRYRLKKKLELDNEVSLTDYLKQIN